MHKINIASLKKKKKNPLFGGRNRFCDNVFSIFYIDVSRVLVPLHFSSITV